MMDTAELLLLFDKYGFHIFLFFAGFVAAVLFLVMLVAGAAQHEEKKRILQAVRERRRTVSVEPDAPSYTMSDVAKTVDFLSKLKHTWHYLEGASSAQVPGPEGLVVLTEVEYPGSSAAEIAHYIIGEIKRQSLTLQGPYEVVFSCRQLFHVRGNNCIAVVRLRVFPHKLLARSVHGPQVQTLD